MSENLNEIRFRLKSLRIQQGLSLQELAQRRFQACYAGPVRQLPSADGDAPVLGTMKNPPAKLR